MSIKSLAAIHLALCSAFVAVAGAAQPKANSAREALPTSQAFLTRVKAKLEVGGDLVLTGGGNASKLPMSVVARFDYFERRIDDGSLNSERRSIRYYADAEAAIKVEKQASVSKLAGDRRLIRAAVTQDRAVLAGLEGYLTREELDLIEIPCNTLLLNKLLLPISARKGADARPQEATMAMLLGLDAVSRSDVRTTLTALTAEVGEVTIEGALNGAVGGVATEIELKGKLHYDIKHRQPFALVMLIKEKRSAGHVAPGLDVVAKLELQIAPVAEVSELSDKALDGLELVADGVPPPLACESDGGSFRFVYEPRWRITRAERDSVVMRLVDRGELVAQCNVSVLPKLNPQQTLTLAMFQEEVQQSLGKNFGYFGRTGERKTPSGFRLLHVVAMGTVSELPITWNYYLLIEESGQRAAISFTMENALADRFGEADRLVLDEFRFVPKPPTSAARAPLGTRR